MGPLAGLGLGVAACYSLATYVIHFPYAEQAVEANIPFWGRVYFGSLFLTSPISFPLTMLLVAIVG